MSLHHTGHMARKGGAHPTFTEPEPFPNFPSTTHGLAVLGFTCSAAELQRAIVKALGELNTRVIRGRLGAANRVEICNGEARFEFGVAHGFTFHFLDQAEVEALLASISNKALETLDFIGICCYYLDVPKGRRKPLRFDRHLIRLTFGTSQVKIRLHHEKGPRRLPLDELLQLIIGEARTQLDAGQRGLVVQRLHAV